MYNLKLGDRMKSILAAMLLLLLASVATAKVVYVPDNYPTIQQAVNAASDGDTIVIRDGVYIENIKINKSIIIKSENGSANCILQAAYKRKPVFDVNADHVNISGFTIKNSTAFRIAGIRVNAANCNIANNSIQNNYIGVYLRYSDNNYVKNNVISNNTFGIELYHSKDNVIKNKYIDQQRIVYQR